MTLPQAYYALAAFLLLAGGLVSTGSPVLRTFRRSKVATWLLGLLAIGWFAWWLQTGMPDADFAGLPRLPVQIVFIGFSVLAFCSMPDFLSVRALAVIMLFLARTTLDAGIRQLPASLLDASISYGFLVLFGFWWAASPPVFNRQCDWVLATPGRHRFIGGLLLVLAAACLAQSFRVS